MVSVSRFHLHSAEETRALGQSLAATLAGGQIIALMGELGAGKTTLVQGILAGLGVAPPYPSPTFILMHQYALPQPTATGIARVYHVDAYRVDAPALETIGWEEWVSDSAGVVLLEWPERVEALLPERIRWIRLAHADDDGRRVEVSEVSR